MSSSQDATRSLALFHLSTIIIIIIIITILVLQLYRRHSHYSISILLHLIINPDDYASPLETNFLNQS
jgi:hypothetical protein